MHRIAWLAVLACSASAYADWLTLVGSAGKADDNYIQVDPQAAASPGGHRTLDIRVNRSQVVADPDGLTYRSMTAEASVDCLSRTARYLRKTYFGEPNFSGQPVHQRFFGPRSGPPLQFDGIRGNHAERLIKAACAQ